MTAAVNREVAALKATIERRGPLIESASVSAVGMWPRYVYDDRPYVVTVAFRPDFATRSRFATREEAEAYRDAASEIIDEVEQDNLRSAAFSVWEMSDDGRGLDELTLRAAAQHAQAIGDYAAERAIDSRLAVLEARR